MVEYRTSNGHGKKDKITNEERKIGERVFKDCNKIRERILWREQMHCSSSSPPPRTDMTGPIPSHPPFPNKTPCNLLDPRPKQTLT